MSTEKTNEEKARELAEGLRQFARVVESNPDLYEDLNPVTRLLSYIPGGQDVRERMLTVVQACTAAGARPVENTTDAKWASVDLFFGPVALHVYAERSWLGDVPTPPVQLPAYQPLLAPRPECTCSRIAAYYSHDCPAHRQHGGGLKPGCTVGGGSGA